jgi:GNAT superfamily N-acetyltransferase
VAIEVRALQPDERESCLNLWCTVWSGPNTDRYFRRYFYGDVEWLPYYTQVAVDHGRVVSAVHICKRTVACGEFKLTMGGIANVATLPEYRGKGYNTACLRAAITVMEADAMDFSLLFTGINGYYAREGYCDGNVKRFGCVVPEADVSPPTSIETREAIGSDLPDIREIYAAYNAERPIAVVRSEAYWRDWIGDRQRIVALDASGRVGAYLSYRIERYQMAGVPVVGCGVTEFGVRSTEDTREMATALLQGLAAAIRPHGAASVEFKIPVSPDLVGAAETVFGEVEVVTNRGGMLRLMTRDGLLRGMAPELNERWSAASRPAGALTFATPYGPVSVVASGDLLKITPEAVGPERSQSDLFRYLLAGADAQDRQDPSARLLFALFPDRSSEVIYWEADGF